MRKETEPITLPPVSQIGVVVRDVDKAIEYYSKNFGLGPFKTIVISRKDAVVRGKPANYKAKLAFADMGQAQLELIEILEGETIQKEFLNSKGEGIHHLGFIVKDLEGEVAKWEKGGFGVLQRSKPGEPGFAYMDTERVGGVILELIQPQTERK